MVKKYGKPRSLKDYQRIVDALFEEQEIITGAGYQPN